MANKSKDNIQRDLELIRKLTDEDGLSDGQIIQQLQISVPTFYRYKKKLRTIFEKEWAKSLALWISYITATTDEELSREVTFIGFDEGLWAATPKDIALQLNYHSIHHRAQIQTIIRQQGMEPDFVDYIGTKYRKLS